MKPMYRYLLLCLLVLSTLTLVRSQNGAIDPDSFLPHTYGQTFTPHHLLVDYYQEVASISQYVQLHEYGRTSEFRPLIYAIVTHPKNLEQIEEIRLNNLKRAGLLDGKPNGKYDKSIIWLSLGVHGNEGGSTESAIEILHRLTDPGDQQIREWLKEVVIILDPCLNPDGFSRYTGQLIGKSGKQTNAHRDDNTHHEAWPNGRVNHYLHDLNRDWVWASQKETVARLQIYRKWLPHIHADFHELYPNNHSYFAPAAEPYHPYITDYQRDLETRIGRHNASFFDQNKWLYFTKERFDLFYPAYGDSYPMINGAIGMTYEQPGHGSAATTIKLQSGDTLTLSDRIERHTTMAISTLEFASKNSNELIESFARFFRDARDKAVGDYKSYVLRDEGEIEALLELLDMHDIKYGMANSDRTINGFLYKSMDNGNFEIQENDIVVPVEQAQGRLVQVLFEPVSVLSDSLTDDLTSWALPFAFGIETVATKEKISYSAYRRETSSSEVKDAYAWIIERKNSRHDLAVARLIEAGARVLVASVPFTLQGKAFDSGSFVVFANSDKQVDVKSHLRDLVRNEGIELFNASTGWTDEGPDLGSRKFRRVKKPEILIVGGKGMSQYNYGQIWHYLDEELSYPYTTTTTDKISQLDLSRYSTIILPESYRYPGDALKNQLLEWVKSGGHLIAFGYTVNKLAESEEFGIKVKANKDKLNKPKPKSYDAHRFDSYGYAERKGLSNDIPGISILLTLDNSHPLAYGMGTSYISLKTSATLIPMQSNSWNVGFTGKEIVYSGFAGNNVKNKLAESCSFFVKDIGRGKLTALMDNPLYRSFWKKGEQLFFNAVFLVP